MSVSSDTVLERIYLSRADRIARWRDEIIETRTRAEFSGSLDSDHYEIVCDMVESCDDEWTQTMDHYAHAWCVHANHVAYLNARGMTPISYLETIRSLEELDAPRDQRWDPLDEFSIHEAGSNAPPNMIEEHHE